LAILTVQVVFGVLLKIRVQSTKETMKIPSLINFHLLLGASIYLLTKIQVLIGFYMFLPQYMAYLLVYFGALLIFRIQQEYHYRFQNNISGDKLEITEKGNPQSETHKKLLALLNHNSNGFVLIL